MRVVPQASAANSNIRFEMLLDPGNSTEPLAWCARGNNNEAVGMVIVFFNYPKNGALMRHALKILKFHHYLLLRANPQMPLTPF